MAMTVTRLLNPALRSGLMIAAGSGLIALPVVLGLSAAAIVTGIALGAIATALGLAGTAPEGRGTIPSTAHAVYDRGLAAGLLLTAVLFGIAGETAALAFFGAAGLAALLIASVTSYSTRPWAA